MKRPLHKIKILITTLLLIGNVYAQKFEFDVNVENEGALFLKYE